LTRAAHTISGVPPSTSSLLIRRSAPNASDRPSGDQLIEVRAPGYQTMSFDVDIVAGQVIPYQGALER
jgi:hypothetical protein